jgi:hypothetical protein
LPSVIGGPGSDFMDGILLIGVTSVGLPGILGQKPHNVSSGKSDFWRVEARLVSHRPLDVRSHIAGSKRGGGLLVAQEIQHLGNQ